MSRPDYCRKHGLKYSTFLSWFQGETPIVEPGKFVALTSVHKNAGVICISFPNGIQVEYEGELNESLIQYLQHA